MTNFEICIAAVFVEFYLLLLLMKAVNKLAEIMNRKPEGGRGQRGRKVNETDMRKKEKECRKLEQEVKQVRISLFSSAAGIYF